MKDYSKPRKNYRVGGDWIFRIGRNKAKAWDEASYRTNIAMEKVKVVTMKLTCGPVTDHIGGVRSYTIDGKTTEYIQKNIVMNAVYGKPEDNNFANATPSGKMEFSLSNPQADIFEPGKQYRVTIEEWVN